MKQFLKSHYPIIIFMLVYIVFSFLFYKAIPIANGEEFRYLRGKETLEHLLYGVFAEKLVQPVPNYFLYNLYASSLVFLNPHFYYEWFHLFNLLFSGIIFVCIYTFVYLYSKNKWLSILSALGLIFIPAFFGQMGFNPVDMPYAVFYFLSLLGIFLFRKSSKQKYSSISILLLGVLLGITQGLRQLGLTLYVLLFFYDLYLYKDLRKVLKENFFNYSLIFVVANFFMVITWPNFAINYFKNLWWYVFVGSNFYLWDYGLLFMGKFLENSQRPWFYLPLLQLLTNPLMVSVLLFSGLFNIKKLLKNKIYFLLFMALSINYLLYFVLKPVLYDGTRHFLFMYPLFIILGAFHFLEFPNRIKKIFLILILVEVLFIGSYTLRNFPYQYFYFNPIKNIFNDPFHTFESDYSSTLYRRSAEWLRDEYSGTGQDLKVYSCDNGYAVDYYSHKKFTVTINREEADLIVCDYKILLKNDYPGKVIKTFFVDDVPLIYVLDVKH